MSIVSFGSLLSCESLSGAESSVRAAEPFDAETAPLDVPALLRFRRRRADRLVPSRPRPRGALTGRLRSIPTTPTIPTALTTQMPPGP